MEHIQSSNGLRNDLSSSVLGLVNGSAGVASSETVQKKNRKIQPGSQAAKMLDLVQEAVCVLSPSRRVCFWNTAMEMLTGVSKADACGKPVFDLLPHSFQEHLIPHLEQFLQDGQTVDGEFRHSFRGNDCFAFRYRLTEFPAGSVEKLIMLSFIDTTDGHRLYKEREKQEHLETLGVLSVGVAQELTTPLDQIGQLVEQIVTLLGEGRARMIRKQLDGIISQSYRISSLAHNLLALSHQTVPMPAHLDLNELVRDLVDSWESENEGRLSFTTHLSSKLPVAVGDAMLLQSALQNLVRIAVQFSNDDSVPVLRTCFDRKHSTVSLVIEDRGAGLDKHELDHLFDLFYGGSKLSPGAGLALFISKKIIESQSGTFKISSVKGKGTVFTVSLPALQKDGQSAFTKRRLALAHL